MASSLENFKKKIEEALTQYLSSFKAKGSLKEACVYALSSGGKRLRPLLVLCVGEAVGKGWDTLPSALAVELLHTASLIADDLPCMDNEEMRREKPSLHRAFGESTALLASYALISMGYDRLAKNAEEVPDSSFGKRLVVALKHASLAAGLSGALDGQFLDLSLSKPTFRKLCQIIYKKTITLFEISFLLGWIFGGGDLAKVGKVKKIAFHLGMAFQVADDLQDLEEDIKRNNQKNMAAFLGKEKAKAFVKKEMKAFISALKEMSLYTKNFQKIEKFLSQSL